MNEQTVFWLVLAVVLAVIEACTVNLVTIWLMFSAVIVAVVSAAADVGVAAQGATFVVAAAVLLALTRPFVKRFVRRKTVSTNADRIIGADGIVTEKIDPIEGKGQVKVMGQIWSAVSESGEPIESGTAVFVTELKGVKAVVEVKKQ